MPRDAMNPLSPFQQVSLVVLRTMIGWHFLYEGLYKFRPAGLVARGDAPRGVDLGRVPEKPPAARPGGWRAAAVDAGLLPWIDKLVMFGLHRRGRLAAAGALHPSGVHRRPAAAGPCSTSCICPPDRHAPDGRRGELPAVLNKTLIEGFAVLALFFFRHWTHRWARSVVAP